MRCPSCDEDLKIAERKGIEIDYCPRCRGVWLDRGELDKIIERSTEFAPQASYPHYRHKKHKSLLGELFDF